MAGMRDSRIGTNREARDDLVTRLDALAKANRGREMCSWWPTVRERLTAAEAERDAAEDFRAEIVLEAFTAPDASWDTILDSLRARIRDLAGVTSDGECQRCGGVGCEACDAREGNG